jgi:hypothetical protein
MEVVFDIGAPEVDLRQPGSVVPPGPWGLPPLGPVSIRVEWLELVTSPLRTRDILNLPTMAPGGREHQRPLCHNVLPST